MYLPIHLHIYPPTHIPVQTILQPISPPTTHPPIRRSIHPVLTYSVSTYYMASIVLLIDMEVLRSRHASWAECSNMSVKGSSGFAGPSEGRERRTNALCRSGQAWTWTEAEQGDSVMMEALQPLGCLHLPVCPQEDAEGQTHSKVHPHACPNTHTPGPQKYSPAEANTDQEAALLGLQL